MKVILCTAQVFPPRARSGSDGGASAGLSEEDARRLESRLLDQARAANALELLTERLHASPMALDRGGQVVDGGLLLGQSNLGRLVLARADGAHAVDLPFGVAQHVVHALPDGAEERL